MIVLAYLGDAEADRYLIEKRRVRQLDTARAEIRADMEDELVQARPERLAREKRTIAPAVIIGDKLT